MKCRFCNSTLKKNFADLGNAPPSNSFKNINQIYNPEIFFPLQVFVCSSCLLVQTKDFVEKEKLFTNEYVYFSSASSSWLEHARVYSEHIISKLNLNKSSMVIEIASNDGYLLVNFLRKKIPCLGIEPTESTARVAIKKNIPVIREFLTKELSLKIRKKYKADLICANNVYAHVPDINDFTRGLKNILKPNGTITLEFPHLLNLIKFNQFDTIYHEHYSYLSLIVVKKILKNNHLRIYEVQKLNTHGGSLRVYACHENSSIKRDDSVVKIINEEILFGLKKIGTYLNFQDCIYKIANNFLLFLIKEKNKNKKIIGYGAAAKGNTLLNFCGIKSNLLDFVCDASPSKQNKLLPGSNIVVLPPSEIKKFKPDWIIIFPWNIVNEIINELSYVRAWNCKFVTTIPNLKVIN